MTLSSAVGVAAVAVLLGGAAISGQGNRVPGPDLAGIAETKAMHTEIIRAIEANTRTHIVIARLASQDARVSAAIALLAGAQRELNDTASARMAADGEIRRLSQEVSRLPAADRAAGYKELSEKRTEATALRTQEQALRTQLPKLQQALSAEQTRRTELSGQLDQLEASLSRR